MSRRDELAAVLDRTATTATPHEQADAVLAWLAEESAALEHLGAMPLPVYKTPNGHVRQVTGRAADEWPYPQEIRIGDALFHEVPLGSRWGCSFHHVPSVWRRQTPVGVFMAQYAEGMASGFPWWPVVVFSLRVAVWWCWPWRRRHAA